MYFYYIPNEQLLFINRYIIIKQKIKVKLGRLIIYIRNYYTLYRKYQRQIINRWLKIILYIIICVNIN